ncbi:unnamed protein product [Phyllotreta striolata]|uniref:Nardilysin n=1 Tax=Phyllotreta striolata TaxID=444603 RepID=A0A9N9TRL8_PHYSR|nr:unnamed protein product [Phyllotreta striolata]
MNSSGDFDVLETPIKSESDKKIYKVIKLKNELVACIISDPSSNSPQGTNNAPQNDNNGPEDINQNKDEKKAAAMLSINVGSFSDPEEVQGLAHFLEHMVFMGSEKYPTENDFSSFVSKRGGSYNAFTESERTCFYFDCLEKHLKETLDRFAQFFIGPLLLKDSMTREREAVDSEFQMASVCDYVRKNQIILGLAEEGSPVRKFACGNLKTLKSGVGDDELREITERFRARHYSSNRMAFAIQSRLTVEELQELIVEIFTAVPNNGLPKLDFECSGDVFDTPAFNRIYYMKPIDEQIELCLTWRIPNLYEKYKTKTQYYFQYILGDEGTGSLLSYLKKRVWATSLYSFGEDNSIYTSLGVIVQLTEEGCRHVFDIIEAIFSYAKLVRDAGPVEYIHEDIKTVRDASFRFSCEESSLNTVLELEEAMHRYPPELFLTGSKIHYDFDPDEIASVSERLTVDYANIFITNKHLPDGLQFDKTEKWCRTEYTDVPIPEDLIDKCRAIEPFEEFSIPPSNPYIVHNFAIVPEEPDHPEYPRRIVGDDRLELWYRRDQKFKLPFAYYNISMRSSYFAESAKNAVLGELFTDLLSYYLNEETYQARQAELSQTVYFDDASITVTVEGFNEKLPVLIDVITKYFSEIRSYISEKTFSELKEEMMKTEYNAFKSPAGLNAVVFRKIYNKTYWTCLDKYNELLNINYEDLLNFIDTFKEELYLKVLIQGNVLPEVAIDTVNALAESLRFDPLPDAKLPSTIVNKLPIGEKCVLLESFDKSNPNSDIQNYYQVGEYRLKDSVILDLIMMVLEEPAFDALRTKEQLGYSVYCGSSTMDGILVFFVSVTTQAHKFTTEHVDERIEAFIRGSQSILEGTSEEEFRRVREDYVKTKECVDVHLAHEVWRNWDEIDESDYVFDRQKREIRAAEEVTWEEVKRWWRRHNHFGDKENFRKVSVQVRGHVQDEEGKTTVVDELYGKPVSLVCLSGKEREGVEYFVRNIDEFKERLENYPPKVMKKCI